jgi:ATP-dependent Clp protease ATP-binding subunit ClpX
MNNDPAVQAPPACSFCARPRHDVGTLIAGRAGYICDACVTQCGDVLHADDTPQPPSAQSPRALYDYLSRCVIGQEAAKRQLAVSVFHHQFGKRGAGSSRLLRKQNLLFLGPTGSGKTYLLKSLAKGLDIPFVTVSATAFSKTGYVGDEVDSIIRYLLDRCDNDVERAKNGIVFIDEIDKLASTTDGGSGVRDVSGTGVQQDLLTMMEGSTVRVPTKGGPRHLADAFVEVDTENVMFVVAGAFVGLEDIVEKRLKRSSLSLPDGVGDGAQHPKRRENELRRQVLVEDLIEFGLLPEFAGRFTAYVPFDHLLTEDLVTILDTPAGSPIHEYRRYFAAYDVELVVEADAVREIAEQVDQLATGARGLRSIVDRLFQDTLFDLPSWEGVERVVFTRDVVAGDGRPALFGPDSVRLPDDHV